MSDQVLQVASADGAAVGAPPSRPGDLDIATLDARLRAVERLLKIFAVERYIYLAISIASFLIMAGFAAYLFATSGTEGRSSLFALLFVAPSGAIVYVSGAFLRMWTQALQVLGGKVVQ